MPGFPEWGTVSIIEPSPFDANTAYVVVDAHRLDNTASVPLQDDRPRQVVEAARLRASAGRLPARGSGGSEEARTAVSRHRTRRDVLDGRRADRGSRCSSTCRPSPSTICIVKDDDLVARDARPVAVDPRRPAADSRVHDRRSPARPCTCSPPLDAMRWRYGSSSWGTRGGFSNPPHGAVIYYALKDEEKNELKIEILDAQNRLVRTLSSTPQEPMGSDDNEDPDDFKNAALPRERRRPARGVGSPLRRRAQDQGRQDRHGRSGRRPARRAGRLHRAIDRRRKTLTAPLKVVADPRGDLPSTDPRRRPRSRSACATTSRGSPTWSTSCAPSASS